MKPALQALVLAERVYTDRATGKKIIAGTFNLALLTHNVPLAREECQPGGATKGLIADGTHAESPCLYLSLTDVVDQTEIKIQFVSLTRNEVLYENKVTLSCTDRLKTIEIIAPLPPLQFPEAGTYAFEVLCEGEIIGSYRVIATELP